MRHRPKPPADQINQLVILPNGLDNTTYTVRMKAFNKVSANGGELTDHIGPITLHTTSISTVSPSSGTTAGGTAVTITGANFDGAVNPSDVTSNGVPAQSYTVVNSSTITAVTPAGTAGWAAVTVTTPIYGSYIKAHGYTYF